MDALIGFIKGVERFDSTSHFLRRGAGTVDPPRRKAPGPGREDARTQWLVDRADIHDLIVQGVFAIDRRDPAMLAECLAPGFRYSVGEETIEDATALAAYVTALHAKFEGLHHLLGNHLVEVHGDWARAETYVYVTYRRTKDGPLSRWSNGARRLVDALVRHDGRWVIRERTVTTNDTPVVRRKDPPSMT
jgi:hypothetical protein